MNACVRTDLNYMRRTQNWMFVSNESTHDCEFIHIFLYFSSLTHTLATNRLINAVAESEINIYYFCFIQSRAYTVHNAHSIHNIFLHTLATQTKTTTYVRSYFVIFFICIFCQQPSTPSNDLSNRIRPMVRQHAQRKAPFGQRKFQKNYCNPFIASYEAQIIATLNLNRRHISAYSR